MFDLILIYQNGCDVCYRLKKELDILKKFELINCKEVELSDVMKTLTSDEFKDLLFKQKQISVPLLFYKNNNVYKKVDHSKLLTDINVYKNNSSVFT